MSIFDGIISAIAGPVVSGAFGLLGASQQQDFAQGQAQQAQGFSAAQVQQQEDFQASEAEKTRQYNENMTLQQDAWNASQSANAIQTRVQDLEKAGLNPMLAATNQQGAQVVGTSPLGSPTPSGNAATGIQAPAINKIGAALSSANTVANLDLIQSQAEKNRADAADTQAHVDVNRGQIGVQNQIVDNLRQQTEQLNAMTSLNDAQTQEVYKRIQKIAADITYQTAITKYVSGPQTAETIANAALKRNMSGNIAVDTVLKQLDVPQATNAANMQDTKWMKYVAPFLPSILQGGTSAAKIGTLLK